MGTAEPLAKPHPLVVNEYGWLWLNRDGSPTVLTEKLYPLILGPDASASDRLEFYAYTLAAETEFFRSSRRYAGVLHFSYLTGSYPGGYTSDSFRDVRALRLDPAFADYLGEAFKPLGVYVHFFQPTLAAGSTRTFPVRLVNDTARGSAGILILLIETETGEPLTRIERDFHIDAFGASELAIAVTLPDRPGRCLLKAAAQLLGETTVAPTVSRRRFELTP